jgi:hypothetical protein
MKDERLYAKFVLDFPDHPKIMPLSAEAFRCLVEATLWSRKHLTDGFLASRYAVARWGLEVLTELSTNDPLNPSLVQAEDGWFIHDFALHQDTKADVEARRERNKRNGQRGGLAKAKQVASESLSKSVSENVAETETETETLTTSVVTKVSANNGSEASDKPTRKRGTRITSEWMPQQRTVDRIKESFPHATSDQIRHQHELFICWATGSASKNAVKLDWEATWSGWMRRELVKLPTLNGAVNGKPSKARVIAELAARVREQEQLQALSTTHGKEITT